MTTPRPQPSDRRPDASRTGPAGVSGRIVLTRDQVRRVDRIATDRYGVPGVVLMENAARGVFDAIRDANLPQTRVLLLCGGGNNGGDGLAVARHLHVAGSAVVACVVADPAKYRGDALTQWRIAQAMRGPTFQVVHAPTPEQVRAVLRDERPTLVVDAVYGTGLAGPPRDPFADLVDLIAESGLPVVAVDLPSGLDCDTGGPLGPRAVHADLTVTFVAEKAGFRTPESAAYTGRVVVAGIGCPSDAVSEAMRPA
jgi:NAD(P)H-hydrate epimerase